MIWAFGKYELDDEHFQLRRDGQPVELRRKVFDVLRYLVTHAERTVSKEELLQQVWPGETIHEAVVAQNIAILRKTLGDSRGTAKLIQTVHGRGYRFVAEVETARPAAARIPTPVPAAVPLRPFVGREHVLEELRGLLLGALAGRGGFAVVTGEAGIGKTRLAEQLAGEASALGARVLEGRCHEGDGAPAYWPWLQVLRAAAGGGEWERSPSRPVERGPDVVQLMRELRGDSALPARPEPQRSAETRFRLFEGVASFLARVARDQPLLLIFDDLHWADEATLHLLRFLAREVRALPLLVLATSRDLDAREGTLPALASGAHVHRVYLSGLSQAATSELATATLQRKLDVATLRELHGLTEGNPFFVHEVLRLFADDAAAAGPDGRWRTELPLRVREVIDLRLQGLDRETRRLLGIASVIGRDFGVAVLEQVAGVPRARLLKRLEAASHARIVRETSAADTAEPGASSAAGHYAFAHALIRESLYAALSEPERVRLHDQVGRALEALFGVDAGAHLSELAHHFYRAASGGEVERAVSYCVRAAEQALAALAFEQAVFHYRRALEALAARLPIDELMRFELKLGLGAAQFRAGEDGNPALLSAADVARRLGRPELLGRVVLAMCGWPRYSRRGRTLNRELYPLLAEAIAAPLAQAPGLRARLLGALALNCPMQTPAPESARFSEEALASARALRDDEALHDALHARVLLMQAPEDTARRLALADELLAAAQRLGQDERIFSAHALRVQPLLALGELATADRAIERCAQLAEALRLPRCALQVSRFRLERALGDGRFPEIKLLTQEAVRLRGQAQFSPGYMVSLYLWRTFERGQRGDRNWFERHIGQMAASIGPSAFMRAHVASLYAQFGQHDAARACYRPLLESRVLDAVRDDDWLTTLALAAEAVAACEDRAAAEALYPRLRPHAALNVANFEWLVYLGSCAHFAGQLCALLGDADPAAEHFEAALEMNARLGARPAMARTSLAYARLLLGRNGASSRADAARGRALLRDASSLAEAIGLRDVLREARQLAD